MFNFLQNFAHATLKEIQAILAFFLFLLNSISGKQNNNEIQRTSSHHVKIKALNQTKKMKLFTKTTNSLPSPALMGLLQSARLVIIFMHHLNLYVTSMSSSTAAAVDFFITGLVCEILSTIQNRNNMVD